MNDEENAINNLSQAIERLKDLEIINSNAITSEIGVYYAKKYLKEKNKINLIIQGYINKDYDAEDEQGLKYEIKTRATFDEKTMRKKFSDVKNKICDFYIFVVLNFNFQPLLITKIPKNYVIDKTDLNRAGDFYQTEKMLNDKDIEVLFKGDLSNRIWKA